VRTRVGYAGGTTRNPTYHDLGDHTESIQVDYDPTVVSYDQLLGVFWGEHDPCAASHSRQYRSAIFHATDEERRAAEASRARRGKELGEEIVTAIEPLVAFTRAEDYHQKYSLRRHRSVLESLASLYPTDRELVDSTAAARLNAYFDGTLPREGLDRELAALGLEAVGDDVTAVRRASTAAAR
jgi:peptide-methionine (S)-S-oxide reductase